MKMLDGQLQIQVKDLIEDLADYDPEALVRLAITEADGEYRIRSVYKTVETADETGVLLYAGDAL